MSDFNWDQYQTIDQSNQSDFDWNQFKSVEKPQQSKGWAGVGQDISESVKTLPKNLLEMIKSLPSEAMGAAQQPTKRIGQNLLSGLAQGGAGMLNVPANIRDYLQEKDIINESFPSLRLPENILPRDYDYSQGVGLEGNQAGDALLQGLSANAPFAAVGELGALGTAGRMGARSGAQVPIAIGQNQDPIQAAATPFLTEAGVRGGAKAIQKMKPSQIAADYFGKNINPQELMDRLRASEGTNTPLGDILKSPTLKTLFENVSTKWPGGGGDQILRNISDQVQAKASKLLDESSKGIPKGDSNRILKDALKDAYDNQLKIKNDLYKPVNKLAKTEGFELNLPSLEKFANEFGEAINNSPLMKADPKLKKAFNDLSKYTKTTKDVKSKILDADGNPITSRTVTPSIVEAKSLANRLEREASNYLGSPNPTDRFLGSKYREAAKNIRSDVNKSIEQKGSKDLIDAYNQAESNYAENFSQFLDKDIFKIINPKTNVDTIINDIIKPGKMGDKFSRIEKILNVLPDEQKNILGHAWLKNAINKKGDLNPKDFAQLINKLGKRQFEALFPDPKFRQDLLDYGTLRGMNEKSLSRMANPPTGQTLAVPSMLGAQMAGFGSSLMHGNIPSAAMYAVGPQAGSRMLNKILTSPEFRNKTMLNRTKKPKKVIKKGTKIPLSTAAIRSQEPFLETDNYEVY